MVSADIFGNSQPFALVFSVGIQEHVDGIKQKRTCTKCPSPIGFRILSTLWSIHRRAKRERDHLNPLPSNDKEAHGLISTPHKGNLEWLATCFLLEELLQCRETLSLINSLPYSAIHRTQFRKGSTKSLCTPSQKAAGTQVMGEICTQWPVPYMFTRQRPRFFRDQIGGVFSGKEMLILLPLRPMSWRSALQCVKYFQKNVLQVFLQSVTLVLYFASETVIEKKLYAARSQDSKPRPIPHSITCTISRNIGRQGSLARCDIFY